MFAIAAQALMIAGPPAPPLPPLAIAMDFPIGSPYYNTNASSSPITVLWHVDNGTMDFGYINVYDLTTSMILIIDLIQGLPSYDVDISGLAFHTISIQLQAWDYTRGQMADSNGVLVNIDP